MTDRAATKGSVIAKGLVSSGLALAVSIFLVSGGLTGQDAPQAPPKGGGKGGFGGKGKGEPPPPAGPMGRLPDGHPDMQGYWNTGAPTDINAKGKGASL